MAENHKSRNIAQSEHCKHVKCENDGNHSVEKKSELF